MINDLLSTNWQEVFEVSCRAIFSLVTLFFITRLLGKKQVSELNLFDYVISISIGNFSAEMSMNLDGQVMNGFIAILIFGFVAVSVSILTMKSIALRRFFVGMPTLIIQDGKFIYKNLKRLKVDINDFLETARIAGYFDISDIKYALMEANGKVSFLPNEKSQVVTISDMNLKTSKKGLCSNVIIDGRIMLKNLNNINKDEKWLKTQLKIKGYKDYDEILLATVDVNEKLCVFDKKGADTVKNVLE